MKSEMPSAIGNLKSAILCAAVSAALAGCQMHNSAALEGHASDDWTRSYPLAAGGEVQVVGGGGSVDVRGGSGSTVDVKAERIALAATDASARELVPRIRIREDVAPEKIVLQTEGLGGIVIGVKIQVNYHLTVPSGASIRVRTADGAVTIADVAGRVVVSSANGEIVGRNLRGGVDARSVNKPLTIELGAFGSDPVDLRAVNGDVDLTLPADSDASLEATATNGTIDVKDLKFEPLGEQTRRRLRGRVNAGGTPIEITAVNGNIRVHPP